MKIEYCQSHCLNQNSKLEIQNYFTSSALANGWDQKLAVKVEGAVAEKSLGIGSGRAAQKPSWSTTPNEPKTGQMETMGNDQPEHKDWK
jgi:hypothetical protein